MNAPLLALLLVSVAPLVAVWSLRVGLAVCLSIAAVSWLSGEGLAVAATALAEGALAALVLTALARRLNSPVLPSLLWLAIALLPWWVPEMCERLDGGARPLSGGWWAAWPGGLLASDAWSPLLDGPLYPLWGSRVGVLGPALWLHLLVLGGAAIALYWRGVRPFPASSARGQNP